MKKLKKLNKRELQAIEGGMYPITRIILEAIGTAAGNFKNGATTESGFFVRSTFF